MTGTDVRIDGELAVIDFDRYDLERYDLFMRVKALPESRVACNMAGRSVHGHDTGPLRAAAGCGTSATREQARWWPAPHLYDYQQWALRLALVAKRFALWLDTGLGEDRDLPRVGGSGRCGRSPAGARC